MTPRTLTGPTVATISTRRRAMALVSAVVVPATTAEEDKHLSKGGNHTGDGFAPAALYPPLTSTLLRLAEDERLQLKQVERALLREVASHALRLTWATDAVAHRMPPTETPRNN